MTRQFGRLEEYDPRSRAFAVSDALPRGISPRSRDWECGVFLDQQDEGSCCGFAWTHELAARPHAVTVNDDFARTIYREAQDLDEWAGVPHSGTSVLAGAKAIVKRGWISEYRWAFGFSDLVLALGHKGPAVLGVSWYDTMIDPDEDGFLRPRGGVLVGGHAILARAVDVQSRVITLHNSWGPAWGRGGECFITFEDMEHLLADRGEACIPIGRRSGDAVKTH